VPIGKVITEELHYIAAELKILEHHRVVYGAPPEVAAERQIEPLKAPMPTQPLEGCMVSASLLAHLLVQKYVWHLPLYRQEEFFQQAGLFIPRSTLSDWVQKAAFALDPIARAIEASIRAGPVLQLDDTPVKCQIDKATSESGKGIRQAYLWSFVNPTVAGVAFRFTEGRGVRDLAPLLAGSCASILLGDAYAANKAAAREAGLVFEYAGCWAHVLRKFKDARKEAPSMVRLFRADLRALYDIEDDAKERQLDSVALAELRQEKARPVIARLLARTLGWKETFSLSGKMADAIKYLRNNRRALKTYLSNGTVPIDNNACERSIRPIAIGRRNWLFMGSVAGGEAAATIFTLIESCKAAGVELVPYLVDVLIRVAAQPANQIDELTPAFWCAGDAPATLAGESAPPASVPARACLAGQRTHTKNPLTNNTGTTSPATKTASSSSPAGSPQPCATAAPTCPSTNGTRLVAKRSSSKPGAPTACSSTRPSSGPTPTALSVAATSAGAPSSASTAGPRGSKSWKRLNSA